MGLAKKYEQSVADLTKYLEKVPNDAEFYFNRGLSLLNLGRKDEAFNDFNKTIELNPAFAPAYRSRGNLYLERGETAKGEADLLEWEKRKKK
jgi:tetratricopeptide (TPR) repeat protein